MTDQQLNSLGVLVIGSLLTFLSTWFWGQRAAGLARERLLATERQAMADRITELETKLAIVNQAVVPISMAFQAILIKELTHFHTPEMDALLVKIGPPNVLTTDDETRLRVMLKARMEDMGPLISEAERDAALILPAVMKRAKLEADTLASATDLKLKLVTVAAVLSVRADIARPAAKIAP